MLQRMSVDLNNSLSWPHYIECAWIGSWFTQPINTRAVFRGKQKKTRISVRAVKRRYQLTQ